MASSYGTEAAYTESFDDVQEMEEALDRYVNFFHDHCNVSFYCFIPTRVNSFIESNLIGIDYRVSHVSLTIEVDNGGLRAHLPMKNRNKPPRLSTDTRCLSNLHSFNPYNSFKNES